MEVKDEKYLKLLSEKYPNRQAVCREIINLNAILNLPKGTEHFMSDLHGEYEAFYHILNNCSGVIREKVNLLFGDILTNQEIQEICTLIYYPREKLDMLQKEGKLSQEWYRMILNQLIEIAKLLSSKYTRSKVRKAMPEEFAYIIDELLHVQKDEDDNQVLYHKKIIDTILDINNADEFIIALSALIKQLAVDHLHIVGDIFDRGPYADKILDLLLQHHSLDIEWGNHDILWMGAAAGNEACIANVIRNNLKYEHTEILESGYGISLRSLTLFAVNTYPDENPMEAAVKAVSVMMFKLEGQIIQNHPEYNMSDRLLLDKIDVEKGTVTIDGQLYQMNDSVFPTLGSEPYELSKEERAIMDELKTAFLNSVRLQKHIQFMYERGSMYRIFNENLLFHGCIPMDDSGNFEGVSFEGQTYQGKSYLDYADQAARRAYFEKHDRNALDFMWYLWCGRKSPLSGRNIKTFERTFLDDQNTWKEETNAYYEFYHEEKTCNMILRDFGLYTAMSHIINGHTPVRTGEGEQPIRANGKLLVIDGGFCETYHKTTGIAGYTLIYNSHGLRIKAHQPFESVYQALRENKDIESDSQLIETEKSRVMVRDTDNGKRIQEYIADLETLLRQGFHTENIRIKQAD
ncbi:MAG: fructose-1,6-bisphosphatase [Lachnospiraceae bacterium]|nr:fructose-1,6-bisphosphatase [Lachnospiraceae bacterium]